MWVMTTQPGQINLALTNIPCCEAYFRLLPPDWDSDADGLPDWWEWMHFGNLNQTAGDDFDGDGLINLAEYQDGIDPNKVKFRTFFSKFYVTNANATGTIELAGGVPSSMAMLVDSTNFSAATWTSYSSNFTANLGSNEGWHDVWVGLRGRLASSHQTWGTTRLKLDRTPPLLVLTGPSSVVSQPMIQVLGYSPEELSSISFDITNAAGLLANQQVLVLDQHYDTNTWEFTTNTFQAFD